MAADTNLGMFFATALKRIGDDAIKAALPLIDGVTGSIIANGSIENVIAQRALFMVQLAAAVPNLQSAVFSDLASIIKTDVDALAAKLSAPPAAG
jgi:hypothetical protein